VTTTVIISGQDFGAQQGTSTVTIAGSAVTPTYWSNTSIEAPIPRSVYPGPAQITVTVAGKLSNNASFDVLLPRTVYINRSDRTSTSGNSVAGFALSQYGFTTLPNSPYVSGDSGTNGGSDDNSLALHRATRRLFVANDYSVSAFDIDPVTGELKRTPNCPVSTGGGAGASGIVVNAAGNLVFVSNLCSTADNCRYVNPQISAFTVSPTGILTPVNGSPFKQAAASGGVMNPALIHNDQFLVVTDDAYRPPYNNLIVNSVNAATGALTFATAFEAGTISSSARADPTGMWYYVDDSNIAAKLYGFSFQNSGTPALTSGMPVATKTTSTQPNSMAISVDGSHLYLGSYDSNEVSVFTLNAGVATLMEESPRLLEGVSTITTLGISRNKSQLVVADSSTQALIVYPVNSGVPHIAGLGNTFDIGRASGLVVSE
jgi:6-phosphogluconolactonase (cycloisomerase 2 family)